MPPTALLHPTALPSRKLVPAWLFLTWFKRQEKNKPYSRVAFLVWGFFLVARCLHLVCCTEGAWHEAKSYAWFGHRRLSSPWCPNKRTCWPVSFHSLDHQDRNACGVQVSSDPSAVVLWMEGRSSSRNGAYRGSRCIGKLQESHGAWKKACPHQCIKSRKPL